MTASSASRTNSTLILEWKWILAKRQGNKPTVEVTSGVHEIVDSDAKSLSGHDLFASKLALE